MIGRPITVKPQGSGGAQSISFSPDSKRIAVPGAPGTVGIWEVATGRRVGKPLVIGSDDVEAAIFAEGGRTLIASDDSGSVSMVDIATGRPIRPPLSVGSVAADSLALSPDGRLVAAASFDGSVFVWDAKTGEPYGSPLTADTSPVNEVAFSPDGRTLVSAHLSSAVVWNMDGEQAIGEPLGGPTDLATDVAFSPDGRRLVVGRFEGGTIVYDTRRDDRLSGSTAIRPSPQSPSTPAGTSLPSQRSTERSGSSIRAAGRPSVARSTWERGGLAGRVQPGRPAARGGRGSERRRDGFYSQQRQGEVQLWDVGSRSRVGQAIVPGAGSVLSVAFNPDGTLLATGSYEGGSTCGTWPTQTRRGKPMRVVGRRLPERRVRPERPARRRRRRDRPGARLACARSASGLSPRSPATPAQSPVRPSTRRASFLATTSLFGGDQAVGSRHGPGLWRRVGRKPEARLARRRRSTFRSWGCGTRSAPTASCWRSPASRRSRCCGTSTRRSGASVPARSSAET